MGTIINIDFKQTKEPKNTKDKASQFIENFFQKEIEEKLKGLSRHARFYVYKVLSDITNEHILKAIQEYREKPLAVMLDNAEREEKRLNRFYLYKSVGDTCMFIGGIFETDRIGDDVLCFFGSAGYIGAAQNADSHTHTYYELGDSFGYIIDSLRKIKSPERFRLASDMELLKIYDEKRDKEALNELRRRGILPVDLKRDTDY